jgi:Ser/Thr protein kinase RdoA (MazF antagonist)
MDEAPAPPYAGLTPDCVLDALDAVGLFCDGRLLALNSYENRVYQAWLDERAQPSADTAPSSVVVKFYRPSRWSDQQIGEEHAFVAELAGREIPVVAPIASGGATLHRFAGFRYAVYPQCGGRAPELEDRETLEWIGRFVGRIHAVGAAARFGVRPALDIASFGDEPRDWLLANGFIPPDLVAAWESVAAQAIERVRHCYERAGAVRRIRLHGDCHAGNVLWRSSGPMQGPHFVDFDDCRSGPAV